MKINIPSLFAGICIAISGSIFASSVAVPFVFISGQKAKANEINTNFLTLSDALNQLASKISNVESNVSSVSNFVGATNRETIPISQIDLPVGSKITVQGVRYTIVQFEFPRFDTDEAYIIKFPSDEDFSKTYAYEYINVGGQFKGESLNGYDQTKIAVISEFPATIEEGFSFYSTLQLDNATRSTTASFSQGVSATINVGTVTQVRVNLSYSSPKADASSKILSLNTSDISHAYPPTPLESEREQIRADLRTLLNYIVIQKK